jgi:hypothetical protein
MLLELSRSYGEQKVRTFVAWVDQDQARRMLGAGANPVGVPAPARTRRELEMGNGSRQRRLERRSDPGFDLIE